MSRRRDYHVFYDDTMPLKRQDDTGSVGSTDSRRRYQRSASIAVATEPTSTGLSFILDMDKEEAVEHSQSLHEDIEKMFDKTPKFSLEDLTSGTEEAVPSTIGIVEEETPKWADRHFDDTDFKSHRRASFPHTHHVLGSISSHSSKNFASLIEEAEEEERKRAKRAKKEKEKKKKQKPQEKIKPIFPSKSATMSPAIPEVEVEEFSSFNKLDSEESEDDDDEDDKVGESSARLIDESEVSLHQLLERESSPKIVISDTTTAMDTTTSLEHHKKESTPKDEDEISSPKLVQWDTSPLTSEADTGSEAALIQFDDIDSKLLPLPKVSSIPSSESSNLSDYMQDKVQGSEEGATSIPHLDPNLLRVKKTEAGGSSFESRSSVSVSPHPGFYIGMHPEHPDTPVGGYSYSSDIGTAAVDEKPVVILLEDSSSSSSDDENEKSPLISTAAQPLSDVNIPTSKAHRVSIDKVRFQLGEQEEGHITDTVEEEPHLIWLLRGDDGMPVEEENKKEEKVKDEESEKKEKEEPEGEEGKVEKKHRKGSSKSLKSDTSKHGHHKHRHHHHHHHHHEHHKKQDLLSRRQRGSEVTLADAIHRVPTETEEAILLHKADLDEMTSHRFEDPQGMRRHKIERKKHKTVSSVVHIGKADKIKRKYFKPSKKAYDHSPHEVFVELDELYHGDKYDYEWREKARWIKFEEDVEEGADRWGKPHVASLSFHSLLELRKGLENGSLLLDLEASDLSTIVHRVVEDMIIHDQIRSENRGQVLRMLLMKHK